jgi:hypothetical protein
MRRAGRELAVVQVLADARFSLWRIEMPTTTMSQELNETMKSSSPKLVRSFAISLILHVTVLLRTDPELPAPSYFATT